MDKATFEVVDPLMDEVAELADQALVSDELAGLRETIKRIGQAIGDRYSVNLSVIVDVFDRVREQALPLLNTGLSTSSGRTPYRTYGDSSPERYVVDGEMQTVPHDRCPKCWNMWDFKWRNQTCPHCGASLGKSCKVLLDTDVCPHCENGTVSMSKPVCDKCGFEVNPTFVVWG